MKELLTKLHKVQSEVQTVTKNGFNSFQKYSYVTLNDILDAVRPQLKALGLVLTQSVEGSESETKFFDGAFYTVSTVELLTQISDIETGQTLSVGSTGMSMDKNGDKAAFKAITGARKYGLLELFALDTAEAEPEDDKFDSKVASKPATKPSEPAQTPSKTSRRVF